MFENHIISATAITLFAMATPAPATATTERGEQLRAKVVKRGNQILYCIQQTATGTRVPRQVCLTEQEMAQTGGHVERGQDLTTAAPKANAARTR